MNRTIRQTGSNHYLLQILWEMVKALAIIGGALNFTYKIYKWMRVKISVDSLIAVSKFISFSFWFVLTFLLISKFIPSILVIAVPFNLILIFLTPIFISLAILFSLNLLTGFDPFGTTSTGPYFWFLVVLFDFPINIVWTAWDALDSSRGNEDANQDFAITALAIILWFTLTAALAV